MKLTEKTIIQGLKKRVSLSGERIACIFDDVEYTWYELDRISDLAAGELVDIGVKKGDHVGLLGVNTIEWLVCYYAIHKIGAIAVLLNYGYLEKELKDVIDYSDVAYLAFGESKNGSDYGEVITHIREELPKLKAYFDMKEMLKLCIEKVKDNSSIIQASFQIPDTNEKDTAVIIFTSGTTLRPKGVMLSHGQIMEAMGYVAESMEWDENDRLLLALPMYHGSGGNTGILVSLHSGMTMVLMRYYRSVPVMQMIEKYQCTVFNSVPSMLLLMIKNPEFNRYDLSSLESGIISGSTISGEQYQKIVKTLGIKKLIPAYGMTEASTLSTMCRLDDTDETKMDSAGKTIGNVEMRIWNCREEAKAEEGQIGEIQIRGTSVMQGYYNMPEKTKESMMDGGWFRTGDAGYLDKNGNLHFRNRITEMIVRGGENISPAEIENCIRNFDKKIDNVKVVGIADAVMQEEVAALVTMTEGNIDKQGLIAYLKERLALFKVPKYVYQIEAFPMTGSSKIDLKKTRAIAEKLTDSRKENKNE